MEAKNGISRKGRWGLANKIEGKSAKLLTPTVLSFPHYIYIMEYMYISYARK
jgi:hypothetical protein